MSQLGLRARLTVFVTATFAAAVVAGAWVALDRIEDSLVADTRSNAEQVLGDYLDTINGGTATVGVVDEEVGTQFFYRDANGDSIDEREYFQLLFSSADDEFSAVFSDSLAPDGFAGTIDAEALVGLDGEPLSDEEVAAIMAALEAAEPFQGPLVPEDPFIVEDSGQVVTAEGVAVQFAANPITSGPTEVVDLGDDVVAVSQTLQLADGSTVDVGVSAPLQPVTDSIDAFATVVWVSVPVLVAMVAGVTWLATSRALNPVSGISAQARAISADRLSERVPVPEAHDEIHELAETVNGMLDRIEASQQRQRRLVSDASHELRSPVAASRAQLEVALVANGPDDWAETAKVVLAEQQNLSSLIDDLLMLSRLDEGEFRPQSDVDVAELVEAEVARPRPVRPHIHQRDGLEALIEGDVRLLERLLRNLVDNAVRHAESAVEVTLHRTTDSVVVHVDDDGPGVPEAHRRAVFERFTRLDEARDRDRGGSGLGLSIVHEVAAAHGGTATCGEAPIGGARFTVELPAGV
ncbi:MAG: ATP-binding protein [Actinomycetota bacterium]